MNLFFICFKKCIRNVRKQILDNGSCIDSPDWIKRKRETINPKNQDEKCFQFVVTAALNHE